ncbi:MAG: hypothetical protein GXP45_06300 [bacterium]|nr:hypothetical protein [bacterium]
MKKYILYSNDTNRELEPIFRNCGEQSAKDFQTLQGFIDIQKQISSNYSDISIYPDDKLNIYKLLSLQQIIYNNIKGKKLNDRIILPYLGFVESLLKKNRLTMFYQEFTYWFNNYYFKEKLNDQRFYNQKGLVDQSIEGINNINV